MFSSAKMLKKIYLSFTSIWNMFHKIKTEKGLLIPVSDVSSSIMNTSSVMSEKVEIVKPEVMQMKSVEHEAKEYLSQIGNFKSELNMLLQQIPGSFSHPKMEKMQLNNQWKVRG